MTSSTSNIIFRIEENGFANLIFDNKEHKVNKLSIEVLTELEKILDSINNNPQIKILIISSAKKDNFIAGADINEIKEIIEEKDAQEKISRGQKILDKISQLIIPTIAIINGSCLGGGLELALACQYRVGVINPKTILGLPEVNLGVIPGFGGTLRLPELIGVEESIKIILTAKSIDVKKAFKIGLIDIAINQEFLDLELNKFIDLIIKDPLKNNFLMARKKAKKHRLIIENIFLKKHLIYYFANKDLWAKTKGQYLAPFFALEVVRKTYGKKINHKTFDIEKEAFCELVIGETSKNLIEIFFTNEALKKEFVNDEIKDFKIDNAGLLGAGVMGGGIAWLFANNNIKIRIKDITQNAISIGYNQILKNFNYLQKTRKLTPSQVSMKIANISSTLDFSGFNNSDLIIEAVVENIEVKKNILTEVEKYAKKDAIIVSNTSSLSITKMSETLANPERFAGMHFFNPVNRMPLVEIIRGEKTDDKTIAKLVKITRNLGKTPIVVKDVSGFLVNRILLPYILEASYLALEGAQITNIDQAMEKFGMPMGPFILADTVGIDVGIKVMHSLHNAYGDRMKISQLMIEIEGHKDLLGKKSNQGFYLYSKNKSDQKPIFNPKIDEIIYNIRKQNNSETRSFYSEEIVERLMLVMINESAKCLEENVVKNASYLDLAMIMGAGFPAFEGGVLRYADKIGINKIVAKLQNLNTKFQLRYQVSNLLIEMAKNNQKFY